MCKVWAQGACTMRRCTPTRASEHCQDITANTIHVGRGIYCASIESGGACACALIRLMKPCAGCSWALRPTCPFAALRPIFGVVQRPQAASRPPSPPFPLSPASDEWHGQYCGVNRLPEGSMLAYVILLTMTGAGCRFAGVGGGTRDTVWPCFGPPHASEIEQSAWRP